jgi:hypothetical protein
LSGIEALAYVKRTIFQLVFVVCFSLVLSFAQAKETNKLGWRSWQPTLIIIPHLSIPAYNSVILKNEKDNPRSLAPYSSGKSPNPHTRLRKIL